MVPGYSLFGPLYYQGQTTTNSYMYGSVRNCLVNEENAETGNFTNAKWTSSISTKRDSMRKWSDSLIVRGQKSFFKDNLAVWQCQQVSVAEQYIWPAVTRLRM